MIRELARSDSEGGFDEMGARDMPVARSDAKMVELLALLFDGVKVTARTADLSRPAAASHDRVADN